MSWIKNTWQKALCLAVTAALLLTAAPLSGMTDGMAYAAPPGSSAEAGETVPDGGTQDIPEPDGMQEIPQPDGTADVIQQDYTIGESRRSVKVTMDGRPLDDVLVFLKSETGQWTESAETNYDGEAFFDYKDYMADDDGLFYFVEAFDEDGGEHTFPEYKSETFSFFDKDAPTAINLIGRYIIRTTVYLYAKPLSGVEVKLRYDNGFEQA